MSLNINYDIIEHCICTVIHFAEINAVRCSIIVKKYVMLVKCIDIESWDMFIETPCTCTVKLINNCKMVI